MPSITQQTTRIALQHLDLDVVTLRATLRRRRPEIRAHCTARLRAAGLRHRRRRRRRRHCPHRICPPIWPSSAGAPRPDPEAPPQHAPRQKAAQVDAARCLTRMRHPITPSELISHRHQDGMIRTKQMLRWNLQKNNACPAPASDYKKNIRRATGARAGHLVQVFQFKGASETNA